jgi:hypothetical protein
VALVSLTHASVSVVSRHRIPMSQSRSVMHAFVHVSNKQVSGVSQSLGWTQALAGGAESLLEHDAEAAAARQARATSRAATRNMRER